MMSFLFLNAINHCVVVFPMRLQEKIVLIFANKNAEEFEKYSSIKRLLEKYLCFMFLYILRELLMLAESHFGRALFAGTQSDHKPIMGYFGDGSGRLLN